MMTLNEEQMRQVASRVQGRMSDRLRGVWLTFLLRGLFALALGIGALFWPRATVDLLVRLVGIFAILNGAAGLFSAFQGRLTGSYWLPGLVSLAVGAVLLFWPDVTVDLLLTILGIWLVFQGVSTWLMSRQTSVDDPDRGLLSAVGIVAAVVGMVLAFWPGSGAVAISWVIAALALVAGCVLIYIALHVRSARQGINKPGQ
jgi:uncharacterized membrane protein HdeD (DUF308 family)